MPSIGSQFVSSAGPTLKSMSAKPIAIANEKMIWPRVISVTTLPSSSSSCAATLAEIASARKPIASDSPSAITPRITGRRQMRWRFIGDVTSRTTSWIPPSGRADGDGPARRAAHHHALENGLAAVGNAARPKPAAARRRRAMLRCRLAVGGGRWD